MTKLAGPLALLKLVYIVAVLATGTFLWRFTTSQMQTLTLVALVFAGQALIFVLRERRHLWNSRPSALLALFSAADVLVISLFAIFGVFMQPLHAQVIAALLLGTVLFALLADMAKVQLLRRWPIG